MESASVADTARQSLGPVGAYLPVPFTSAPPVDLQREAARRLEGAGRARAVRCPEQSSWNRFLCRLLDERRHFLGMRLIH